MSQETPAPPETPLENPLVPGTRSFKELSGSVTFREYLELVKAGLKMPKDSGEYKFARHQVLRVWSPIAGFVVPMILMIAVLLAPQHDAPMAGDFVVTIVDPKVLDEKLDDIEEVEPPPPDEVEPPPPPDEFTPDPNVFDNLAAPGPIGPAPGPDNGLTTAGDLFSPSPAPLDSVAMIKSPIKMSGIFSSRTPGARGSLLAKYGGGGGGAGGGATEAAVYRALRWLKKYQESDGSWRLESGGGPGNGSPPAMTGLALLAFLAHGETPVSEEFGPTVERAIQWLVSNMTDNGRWNQSDNHEYSQPIATYALAETYGLTKIPMVKAAAEKATSALVAGQNPVGELWNYNLNGAQGGQGERNDLSFSGWCIQALKAAKMAGLEVDGLDDSHRKALSGLRKNSVSGTDGTTAFCYTTGANSAHPLTSAGTLGMQLMGAGKSKEAQQAINWLKQATCVWAAPTWPAGSPIYHWYYTTQVKFQAGGPTWTEWNKQFSPELVRNQIVIPNAIADAKGKMVDIGYWKTTTVNELCQSYVYNTTLCALMLEVYYRYLPTYQAVEDIESAPGVETTEENKDVDVQIL